LHRAGTVAHATNTVDEGGKLVIDSHLYS
jgi:hypothetical protein